MIHFEDTNLKISRLSSFKFAIAGLRSVWSTEINFRIHFFIAIFVLCLGIGLNLNALEWVSILLCIGMVLSAEIFNTAIEQICDMTSKEIMPEIKAIKDISASGVFILTIISVVIGLIIFLPKVIYTFLSL